MNEELAITIGRIARAAREEQGLTQAEVGPRVGLLSTVYSRLERGKMLPSVPTLYRLCTELKVSPEDLLGLTGLVRGRKGQRPRPREDETPALRRLLYLARKLDAEKLEALLHVATVLTR
ncbi:MULTISPECIES: helix-turn-helix domain-containing protein [unclassified Corallococcus]|uniref:helix-turn-helix domain-containing protein n=1 Tax=Corallococcus TaxID=83461 RepID=UPI001CBD07F8|nr:MULTISPECIES: helix-turn-helix transcriptional regulator [unclassified Corallococcus]MBZ4334477.1 helix-turn-helix domain-containing protein [Corallococcus sp. AS-1-12]MBZ4374642.1 helix-turn-helix domain-containing protein [Corallococcus sp. AS-1-6]